MLSLFCTNFYGSVGCSILSPRIKNVLMVLFLFGVGLFLEFCETDLSERSHCVESRLSQYVSLKTNFDHQNFKSFKPSIACWIFRIQNICLGVRYQLLLLLAVC